MPAIARDDRFFLITAIVMAVVIVTAFSFNLAMGRSSFHVPWLIHAHAIVFMGWVAIYVTQVALATTGSVAIHRQLGWIAAVWVPMMVILGIAVTVAMVRHGHVPFFFEPAYFLVMNPLAILTFAGLTVAAIIHRRQTDWHRRLHFCAMSILLGPAFGRLLPGPLLIPVAGYAVFSATMIFPVAGIIADRRRSGHVHPAWWWGAGTMIALQAATGIIPYTPIGSAFYSAVTAGSPGAAVAPFVYPPEPTIP
jgi:hypothetical protein